MNVDAKDSTATIYELEEARRRRSDEPGAEYRDAGAWLASAREAAGLSLVEAAAKTHIKERHLEAIEALDPAAMPARPYAIGFVKAYAEYLELDSSDVVARFKSDIGVASVTTVEPEKFEKSAASSEGIEKPELSLLAVVAILGFILWCIWQVTLPHDVKSNGDQVSDQETAAPAAPRIPVSVPENIVPPQVLDRIEPVYPLGCIADAAPVETIVVLASVTSEGRIAGERIGQSSNPCFDAAALNAVRRWRFEPQTVDGQARTAFNQRLEITFRRPR